MKKFVICKKMLFSTVVSLLFLVSMLFGVTSVFAVGKEDTFQVSLQEIYGHNPIVEELKTMSDFNGNLYNLYEIEPIGFFVFDKSTGEFLEGSKEILSPYDGFSANLIYAGFQKYLYDKKIPDIMTF